MTLWTHQFMNFISTKGDILLERLGQNSLVPNSPSHCDEIELQKIRDFISDDTALL